MAIAKKTLSKKKKTVKMYEVKIKISAKCKQDLELCASKQLKTVKQFIKESIEKNIIETKLVITENNTILYNQLNLFEEVRWITEQKKPKERKDKKGEKGIHEQKV